MTHSRTITLNPPNTSEDFSHILTDILLVMDFFDTGNSIISQIRDITELSEQKTSHFCLYEKSILYLLILPLLLLSLERFSWYS
jgi:hypoxanthine phosphoribosyltransferase